MVISKARGVSSMVIKPQGMKRAFHVDTMRTVMGYWLSTFV